MAKTGKRKKPSRKPSRDDSDNSSYSLSQSPAPSAEEQEETLQDVQDEAIQFDSQDDVFEEFSPELDLDDLDETFPHEENSTMTEGEEDTGNEDTASLSARKAEFYKAVDAKIYAMSKNNNHAHIICDAVFDQIYSLMLSIQDCNEEERLKLLRQIPNKVGYKWVKKFSILTIDTSNILIFKQDETEALDSCKKVVSYSKIFDVLRQIHELDAGNDHPKAKTLFKRDCNIRSCFAVMDKESKMTDPWRRVILRRGVIEKWGKWFRAPTVTDFNAALLADKKRKEESLVRENDLMESPRRKSLRNAAFQSLSLQGRQMKRKALSDQQLSFAVGSIVQVPLHDVDTTKADGKNLTLVVVEVVQPKDKSCAKYRLACKAGVLDTLYHPSYMTSVASNTKLLGLESVLDEWTGLPRIKERRAAASVSMAAVNVFRHPGVGKALKFAEQQDLKIIFFSTTMGLAFSSPKTNITSSGTTCHASQTPRKNTPSSQSVKILDPPNTVLRRSRRLTKNNPPKVLFPTYPEAKSPAHRSYPLTPRTRAKVVVRLKPILRRSPRFSKHKFCKTLIIKHGDKSVVTMVSPPSPDGSVVTAATENST
ncbi:hypothetical protein HJC23_012527 [Cyclotella cryptica]|uniref:TFIIS central domain-containing protein n=1 Tax=Cyclotella cryptica TaxID=29204 RepID=A0ABD3QQ97_9STRA